MVVNWQHSLSTAVNHQMIRAYGCGNGHLTYQTSFEFGENQQRFKRDQYAKTVGAGIWKNCICGIFYTIYVSLSVRLCLWWSH